MGKDALSVFVTYMKVTLQSHSGSIEALETFRRLCNSKVLGNVAGKGPSQAFLNRGCAVSFLDVHHESVPLE